MESDVLSVGSRVQVLSHGPFRGLRGTIRTVDTISPGSEDEEPFCFYKISLEGTQVKEPIWFSSEEVALLSPLSPYKSLVLEKIKA